MKWGRPRPPVSSRASRSKSLGGTRFGLAQSFGLTFAVTLFLSLFLLFRQRQWTMSGQRTVVIVQEGSDEVRRPLTLAVVEPSSSKLILLPLPRTQYVAAAIASYGTYQTDALVGLTQLENLRWEFLQQTIALEYGITVDGVIWTKQSQLATLSDIRTVARSGVLNQVSTTLPYWDRWSWYQMLSQIPAYQVETAPLGDWLSEDGRLREQSYDTWAETRTQDPQVRRASLSVVIQNGSGVQGQANRVARGLRLMGFGVRNIDTVSEEMTTKIVLSPSLSNEASVRWSTNRLQRLFPYAVIEKNADITERTRADVVVILGKDQGEGLTLRRRP